ncbi:hypothetical protein Salat_2656100 [Sesamum alatum]|uniref:Uncharacterized protein n=1 Tax=Sesamum alatum TaxID=300844 RepID=A0AAE2CAZ3_9LAMI|nr:hypothetical protein Salat_2656100 [Sesamum alatum]
MRGTLPPYVLVEFEGIEGSSSATPLQRLVLRVLLVDLTKLQPPPRPLQNQLLSRSRSLRDPLLAPPPPKPSLLLLWVRRVLRSSLAKMKAKKKAMKDANEVEDFKILQEMQNWWKSNCKELRTSTQRVAEMVGEKRFLGIVQGYSTPRTHAGQDFWELFKAILCDRDQALLGRQSHTKACSFGHNMSLKCSAFREDKKALVSSNTTLLAGVEALKTQLLEMKTSSYAKIKTLGGFVEGFDQNRLDPTLDAKLQIPNVDEPPASEPNEFGVLIDEIEGDRAL